MIITDSNQDDQYGIVIDAGSSGSRIHIYQWDSPQHVLDLQDQQVSEEDGTEITLPQSVPQIRQDANWTQKISPGLSSFKNSPNKAYSNHIKKLLEFAKDVIPANKISETPVFIQATAGMRLLSKRKQDLILQELCKSIKTDTSFLLKDCSSQIQIIDGETEGLYGWLSLNYLLGNFNNFDSKYSQHPSSGFMDMGGASTQLAFMPSDPEQITRHKEDMHTIYLKNVNGDVQEWDVFVSTWLGFGANKARSRYLAQLINSLPENANDDDDDDYETRKISDPCLPKGAQTDFEFKDHHFEITGAGDFVHCMKSMYPLLLNNLPCSEEPCLFNGVHAPKINFEQDRFVGISEYWYTANDVFKMNGEYNFHEFSSNVKDFCESNWTTLRQNNAEGLYNGISDDYLMDSCFKANWILNILHEGFDLPRINIDVPDTEHDDGRHIPFKSAEKINNHDLSWTLGRILMYASGLVTAGDKSVTVGIEPSSMDEKRTGKQFIPGVIEALQQPANNSSFGVSSKQTIYHILTISFVLGVVYIVLSKFRLIRHMSKHRISDSINTMKAHFFKLKNYSKISQAEDTLADLEEGSIHRGRFSRADMENGSNFRSRSMINLGDSIEGRDSYPLSDRDRKNISSPNQPMRPVFSMADFSKFKNTNRD
ncbi:unnamed protein product [Kluyveromyces dobzhanskii CBS 2104]|uniref:WGS project CCBQ000000000 data, contig 00102 n=1 Tax=Kluyveromyces dobzhanskii CBS 2104 TaxID=1427455 RepID=A0A0A8L6Q5_9SACH|nr:unnamed protein product [Kluyveromyces dobzhanskii CBS 2104]